MKYLALILLLFCIRLTGFAQYVSSEIGTVNPTAITYINDDLKYRITTLGDVEIWKDGCDGETFIHVYDEYYVPIISIKGRCWFAENLNLGTRINGSTAQSDNSTIEKHCYNDVEDSCTVWGGLYQWDEAMQYSTTEGAQGLCPYGWHIPTQSELFQFYFYEVNNDAGRLKETGTRYWDSPNSGATDIYGFSFYGAGWYSGTSFQHLKNYGQIWSSKEALSNQAYRLTLYYNSTSFYLASLDKTYSISIRCIKDL